MSIDCKLIISTKRLQNFLALMTPVGRNLILAHKSTSFYKLTAIFLRKTHDAPGQLSLVARASVILGAISIVAMLIGAFGKRSMKMFWLWMLLCMLSFASVINLVMISLEGQ